MKRIIGTICLCVLFCTANAQYNWDVGLKVGASNYLGEMGGKEKTRRDFVYDLKLSQTRWSAAFFARYRFSPLISVSSSLGYARLQGDDALSDNRARAARNLHFRNDIFELTNRVEIFYFNENDVGNRGRYRTDFRANAFVGLTFFYHNPKAQYDGDWVALRPLRTEGQIREYSKVAFAVPAGLGFYFTSKRKHRYGLEFSWYTTFTDYVDDASTDYAQESELGSELAMELANRNPELGSLADGSYDLDLYAHPDNFGYGTYTDENGDQQFNKRGDPTHNDSYLLAQFTYSYVIRGRSNFYRQKYGWLVGKRRRGRKSRAKF